MAVEVGPVIRGKTFSDLKVNVTGLSDGLEASVLDGNPASARVLEKNGFQEEGRRRAAVLKADGFHDLRLFGRLWSR